MVQASQRPARVLSVRKKILYGLLATAFFFAAAECLLTVFNVGTELEQRDPFVGFESSIPLFVEASDDGREVLRTADNKLRYFNAQQFPRQKPAGTFRVFCLGGSTTYGRPYDDSTSFVAWLREMLQLVDEQQSWEVINAGGISYASYRVANVLEELCKYQPDLFIIYTGHNEFLEERTYRTLNAQPGGLRSLAAWLYRTRTFSVVARLLSRDTPHQTERFVLPAEVDTILDHSIGPSAYQRDAQLRADVIAHFEFNLSRCIRVARAAGARVLLVKPACNLKDFSPFKSEFLDSVGQSQQQRWFELFVEAKQLATQGDLAEALAILNQVEAIDGGRAELHFLKGRVHFALGQVDAARQSFVTAVDQDICPLRAVPEIEKVVEQVALERQVPLIDFPKILEHDCQLRHGHKSPGKEYFVDHVHPTIETHRLLALAIMEGVIRTGVVSPNSLWRDEVVALASRRIESRVDPELQARALTNLAQVLSWAGKQTEAGPLALKALRLRRENSLPEDPECMFYAAVYFDQIGSVDEAIALLEKVVRLQPEHRQAQQRLARLRRDQQIAIPQT